MLNFQRLALLLTIVATAQNNACAQQEIRGIADSALIAKINQEDAKFWDRELASKGSTKASKSSKGRREMRGSITDSALTGEINQEDVQFWDRELASKGSTKASKSSKGRRNR